MTSLKEYMARKGNIPRASKTTKPRAKSSALLRGQLTEDAGAVSAAASVLLPADVDLDTRAARMNNFWDALVEYQHQDVVVVALVLGEEQ